MGQIKSEDGNILLNSYNVDAVVIEHPIVGDKYHIVVYMSSGGGWAIASGSKEKMQEKVAQMECWLESGAQEVFQM